MINENVTAENITEYIKKAVRNSVVFGVDNLVVKSKDFPSIVMRTRNFEIECKLGVKASFDFGNLGRIVFISVLQGDFELGVGSYTFLDNKKYSNLQLYNQGKVRVQVTNSSARVYINGDGVFSAEVPESFYDRYWILHGDTGCRLIPPESIYIFARGEYFVKFESYRIEYDINNRRRAEGVYVIHRDYLLHGQGIVIEYPLDEYLELSKILGDKFILKLDGRGIVAMLLHDGKGIEFVPAKLFGRDATTLYVRNALNKIASRVIPWDMAEELEW